MDDLSLSDDLSSPSTKGIATIDAKERGTKNSPATATKKPHNKFQKGSPAKKEKQQPGHAFEVQDLGQFLGELDTNLNAKTLNQLHQTLDGANAFFQKTSGIMKKKKKTDTDSPKKKGDNDEPKVKKFMLRKKINVDKHGFEIVEPSPKQEERAK